MGIIGEPWAPSAPAKTFTADDGSKMTVEVYSAGLLVSDGGGATQVIHAEDTDDPDVKKFGTDLFRRISG